MSTEGRVRLLYRQSTGSYSADYAPMRFQVLV